MGNKTSAIPFGNQNQGRIELSKAILYTSVAHKGANLWDSKKIKGLKNLQILYGQTQMVSGPIGGN